ncbi:phage tail sheath subtilisin-like domain-containing protein [Lysobacter capsici]|uniref:phage tail sheath subtilisin-like domain-containing protein n=1 Tax=Lysobacter capsici TaxID=435897 RepID=UPI001786EBEA|nr:phage tail sheath subtilisin-like domain-containing protein [Lysobacter capsici]UOF17273.1 phage tail sheath subtilisin-like domain-containing protein [Lysobacter capsici]
MSEYLAPGVFVEEVSFRAKSIEGVSTTTTGFVGPTRYGPLNIDPEIVTSLVEFERTYGGRDKLVFDSNVEIDNYMWHGVRAFFEEGGKRIYISRVFTPIDATDTRPGCARGGLSGSPSSMMVFARFPGRAGDARVSFVFNVSQSLLSDVGGVTLANSLQARDVVWIRPRASAPSPAIEDGYYLALWDAASESWAFVSSGEDITSAEARLTDLSAADYELRVITVTVVVQPLNGGDTFVAPDLSLDPKHQRAGSPDSLFAYFAENPASQSRARTLPIVIRADDVAAIGTGTELLNAFFDADPNASTSPPLGLRAALQAAESTAAERSLAILLSDGNDGSRPTADAYEGEVDNADRKTGLRQFEDLEDISIVAAPGSTYGYADSYALQAPSIVRALIRHAERMKYCIAVLDSGDNMAISEVRAMRAQLDSKYAALYYPWVRVLDPLTQREVHMPPSGFVAGIYARNDVNRAVYKAPANEVVNLALGFERFLNKAQQEVLNPEGINCFRYFEGRGMRLWGARTISSDPEWKYVNLRRYFAYLERSIDKGTQWAVFEPNGEQLWANVRRTIEDFLLNEWQNGALLGDKPEKSFFVKCDRSTMSQNDLDNGRLICLIGVAPLRPAEFVIFRIGQWTADRKV